MHEAQMHEANSFLTLTYAPEKLPMPPSVHKREVQLFMKRLRKKLNLPGLRYYACGEYGEGLKRPHYHMLLFGYDFASDRRFLKKTGRGDILFTSDTLDKVWDRGHANIGTVTQQSAGYCTRYILKKQTSIDDEPLEHYSWFDQAGHRWWLLPEFSLMSRGDNESTFGLGYTWYQKYGNTDCHDQDFVVGSNGRQYPVPVYYDKLLQGKDPIRMARIRKAREKAAKVYEEHQTSRRLHDREINHKAKITKLKRDIEE